MVRTDPGALSETTVAWIDRRGNPPGVAGHGVPDRANSDHRTARADGPCLDGRAVASREVDLLRGELGADFVGDEVMGLEQQRAGRDQRGADARRRVRGELAAGPGPRLAAEVGRRPVFSVDLSTREWDGHVVVALSGELDLVDAADVEAALVDVAAREPEIIVDLAALAFIDSGGVAALARGRRHARHTGGDLLLAAPQQPVLRVLTITGLVDDFSVHASVEEAAANARRSRRVVVPLRRPRGTHTIVQSGTPSSGAEHGSLRQQTGEAGASLPHSRAAEPMTVKDGPAWPSAAPIARRDPATVVLFPGCGDDT